MISLAVVGDIAFAGPLADDPLAVVRRIDRGVRDLLKADIVLANLESVLLDEPSQKGGGPCPISSPTKATDALRSLGVDIVSLANNHILDYGEMGLKSTIAALDAAGIAHFGAGVNYAQAARCEIIRRQGLRIGFLGFGVCGYPTRRRGGSISLTDSRALRIIREARNRCDFLVVYFHEGIEAFNHPMKTTIRACRKAAESGADLIVGSHPHTIQGIDRYGTVPIAYSLGNFIMSMLVPDRYEKWRGQTDLTVLGIPFEKDLIRKALVLTCAMEKGKPVEIDSVPITVRDDGAPGLPKGTEAETCRALFRGLCESFTRPQDPVWKRRDEIERGYWGLKRKAISWKYVLGNLHRIRWRHLASLNVLTDR